MNKDSLAEYRRRRDFRSTPEPRGEAAATEPRGCFVVQKHAASRLHFDFRLELGGVLKSWAVPKGPSTTPGDKRLAVHVEDHPLEYGGFEGVIPKKAYGGGTVMLWDRGHWRPKGDPEKAYRKGKLDFTLEGERLKGAWTLVRMSGKEAARAQDGAGRADNWLLIKRTDRARDAPRVEAPSDDDRSISTGRSMQQIARDRSRTWTRAGEQAADGAAAARPDRLHLEPAAIDGARKRALPDRPPLQLATRVAVAPAGDEWIHEIKFDGYRILARLDQGQVRLLTRNGHDWSSRFGEIARRVGALPVDAALLDGEVVALAADGTSSFKRLQEALSLERTDALVYQAFDLLHLDGYDLSDCPQLQRKALLQQLLTGAGSTDSSVLRYVDHLSGQGARFYEQACELGLEGVICKRVDAGYRGGRGRHWLKVKCSDQDEFLVAGYTDPGGSRTGFGALLLGAWTESGELAYTGRVGAGFTDRQLRDLLAQLKAREQDASPFAQPLPPAQRRGVHWVRPELVVDVEFTEWTSDGVLRHSTFRGLREDREPEEIRLDRRRRTPQSAPRSAAQSARARPLAAPKRGRSAPRRAGRGDTATVAGVRISNPDRILYPDQGVTKLQLALYYQDIAEWILPRIAKRPLALLRCPEGHTGSCFFQKHPGEGLAEVVKRVPIEEKSGSKTSLYVDSLAGLVALVQMGVLELHPWGCRIDRVERPDLMIFDLDPGPGVSWAQIVEGAQGLIERLEALELPCFVKTTGGKGLHVTVPLTRRHEWDDVKAFTRAVAEAHAREQPDRFTANMAKSKRRGRIFIDYLRNGRGATAIGPYSTRARPGAPVAVPLRLNELSAGVRSDRYTVENLRRRLTALEVDPWEAFDASATTITRAMRAAVGLD